MLKAWKALRSTSKRLIMSPLLQFSKRKSLVCAKLKYVQCELWVCLVCVRAAVNWSSANAFRVYPRKGKVLVAQGKLSESVEALRLALREDSDNRTVQIELNKVTVSVRRQQRRLLQTYSIYSWCGWVIAGARNHESAFYPFRVGWCGVKIPEGRVKPLPSLVLVEDFQHVPKTGCSVLCQDRSVCSV